MKLAILLVALAALTYHHAALLPLAVLAAAGAVAWFAADCLRWPQVTTPLDDWSGTFA